MSAPRNRPQWFYDVFGGAPRRHEPSPYPAEGTPAGACPQCGGKMFWMYGYKRRRPHVRCLTCDPLLKAER